MIQAIRFCLLGSVAKLTDKVQKDLIQLLESYQTSSEDSTRTVSAACLGSLCHCLDDNLLTSVLNSNLLGEMSTLDLKVAE